MFVFYFFLSLTFSLNTLADYTEARRLSPQNISADFGIVLVKPSHSFKGILRQERIFRFDYRFESREKYHPPLLLRFETQGAAQDLTNQIGFSTGTQFPRFHRKTPIYFGSSIGVFYKKNEKFSLILQIFTSIRAYQFSKSVASMVHINAYYDFDQSNFFRSPLISLSTGINLNL